MERYKVCAVVVTYNRKELLARNLDASLRQNYPLDILIYDNASTDGTREFLKEKGYLDRPEILYVRGDRNRGGSGGFCRGEKEAMKRGYDFLWLMDDDGYCLNGHTLEECLRHYDPDRKMIVNSYIVCNPETMELTFDMGPYKTDAQVRAAARDGVLHGLGYPFNGTLVPARCFEEVGYTDERFFIYGDEKDFVARSRAAGYEWITPLSSLYYHPVNRKELAHHSFLGMTFSVREQPVWKFYLETRNNVYVKLKYGSGNRTVKKILYFGKMAVTAVQSGDRRFRRLKWGCIALSDGIRGNFDRPIPFGE